MSLPGKASDELVATRRRLAAAEAELAQVRDVLGAFLGAASHDLLSPLQTILGFTSILERKAGEPDPKSLEYLDFIKSGALRMQALVQALVDHARCTEGQADRLALPLGPLVDEAKRHLQEQIDACGAQISVRGDLELLGDRQQLVIVLRHLLANALLFRGDAPPEITVEARAEADGIHLCISDNGIGIEAEQTEAIFEPLLRLHGPAERRGAGMGLATCRRIVAAHGGRIWAESEPGRGSRLRVVLPKLEPSADAPEAHAA